MKKGNALDGLSIKVTNVKAKEALYIQLGNDGNTPLKGINAYVMSDIKFLAHGLSATRNTNTADIRYDFSLPFQLPDDLYIPRSGAVIVRFDGDRRLGDNYIRFGKPVEYDAPDGPSYRDKFDIWAQDYKTFGDELLLCPPKFNKPYFVSGKSYWENNIVNYKIYYGLIHPLERLV